MYLVLPSSIQKGKIVFFFSMKKVHVTILLLNTYSEEVSRFLKGLCADPKVDCYDLMTAITGIYDSIRSFHIGAT